MIIVSFQTEAERRSFPHSLRKRGDPALVKINDRFTDIQTESRALRIIFVYFV